MEMKRYSTFPRAPGREPLYPIVLCHIQDTRCRVDLTTLHRYCQCIQQPLAKRIVFICVISKKVLQLSDVVPFSRNMGLFFFYGQILQFTCNHLSYSVVLTLLQPLN